MSLQTGLAFQGDLNDEHKILFCVRTSYPSVTLKPWFMFLHLAHTNIDIYKALQQLVFNCYALTNKFPPEEKFSMISQIRRAALSVHLNVVEGCSRKSPGERKRYFEVARGSVVEIDAAVGIAHELKYYNVDDVQDLGILIVDNFKQLSALINNASGNK